MKTKSSLTSKQMKEWRMRLEWKRIHAAKQLGIGASSVEKYEQGRRTDSREPVRIPRVVALAMIALEKLTHKDFSDWGLK